MMEHIESDNLFFAELNKYLCGNQSALEMCRILNYICHLWDDLIDKDKPRTDKDINLAFRFMLFDLPVNQFYRDNQAILQPLLLSTIMQYQTANILERKQSFPCRIAAYSMRNEMLHIFGMCIYIIGGQSHYDQCAAQFYEFCASGVIGEFPLFMKEMGHE